MLLRQPYCFWWLSLISKTSFLLLHITFSSSKFPYYHVFKVDTSSLRLENPSTNLVSKFAVAIDVFFLLFLGSRIIYVGYDGDR